MIKALFFDIDGTLADTETHRMTDPVKNALLKLRGDGKKLFISTGRHKLEIEEGTMLGGLKFDGYVLLNGQYCIAGDTVVHRHPIDPADIAGILKQLQKTPFPCAFLEADRIYINYVDDYVVAEQAKIAAEIPPVTDIARALDHEVYQVIPFIREDQDDLVLASMPHCTISRWSETVTDVVPAGGGKEQGIRKILSHFAITQEESMAFGDGGNDITMLRYAGIGVAMGNARPEVKAAADYITADIGEDGICAALRHFRLI